MQPKSLCKADTKSLLFSMKHACHIKQQLTPYQLHVDNRQLNSDTGKSRKFCELDLYEAASLS